MKRRTFSRGISILSLLQVAIAPIEAGAQQLYLTAPLTKGFPGSGTPPLPTCPPGDIFLGLDTSPIPSTDGLNTNNRYLVICSTPKAIQNDPALHDPLTSLKEQIMDLQNQVSILKNNVKTLSDTSDATTGRLESLDQRGSSGPK
ncbi:hypothetical protein [Bradyrhizobium liaoningense]|uniref:hypothetical protein n=1 Tax=Bradyrhizobium liaoningense TaxID=43992 RepID=UPI0012FE74DE|nr:hypothetical protein [Bradyrhizobium liaoningense]